MRSEHVTHYITGGILKSQIYLIFLQVSTDPADWVYRFLVKSTPTLLIKMNNQTICICVNHSAGNTNGRQKEAEAWRIFIRTVSKVFNMSPGKGHISIGHGFVPDMTIYILVYMIMREKFKEKLNLFIALTGTVNIQGKPRVKLI